MPAITGGLANTFEAPNFVGELYAISPEDTPFLSSIGGLTGGEYVNATLFQWQTYDLRDPAANRQRLEGADAPAPAGRKRANVTNVLEIHQEAVSTTYTKQAAIAQYGAANAQIAGSNPVTDEHGWQVDKELKAIARDVEYTLLRGTYQSPADNLTPRKTRGLVEAITTNVTAAAATSLNDKMVHDTMQDAYDSGGLMEGATRTVIVSPVQKRWLTKLFISDRGFEEETRTMGGVSVSSIMTDFGNLNVMINRWMPDDTIVFVSLEECAPVFLLIPDKGFLFVEPLAKTGATIKDQIYGEIGLKYGLERRHAKITGLATTAPPAYGT